MIIVSGTIKSIQRRQDGLRMQLATHNGIVQVKADSSYCDQEDALQRLSVGEFIGIDQEGVDPRRFPTIFRKWQSMPPEKRVVTLLLGMSE